MDNLRRILLFLVFLCQIILTSNSYLLADTPSTKIDSTEVKYFYNNFENLDFRSKVNIQNMFYKNRT